MFFFFKKKKKERKEKSSLDAEYSSQTRDKGWHNYLQRTRTLGIHPVHCCLSFLPMNVFSLAELRANIISPGYKLSNKTIPTTFFLTPNLPILRFP